MVVVAFADPAISGCFSALQLNLDNEKLVIAHFFVNYLPRDGIFLHFSTH